MKDNRYFELRQLTENILLLRQNMESINKNTYKYISISKLYDELCHERYLLEKEIFDNK